MNDNITKPPSPSGTDLHGQEKALTLEEKLEEALEETMDGSDPPSVTAPGDHGDPVPSSGFPEGEQTPK